MIENGPSSSPRGSSIPQFVNCVFANRNPSFVSAASTTEYLLFSFDFLFLVDLLLLGGVLAQCKGHVSRLNLLLP